LDHEGVFLQMRGDEMKELIERLGVVTPRQAKFGEKVQGDYDFDL